MSVMEKFQSIVEGRHEYAQEWKETHKGPVMGYLCTWVPEELVAAAGGLPVRIMGSHEPQDVTEPHIFSMFCPYSRDCLAQGLLGRYNYLDGIVYAHGCYHIRQTFDSWTRHIPPAFRHFIFMPTNVTRRGAQAHTVKELAKFKEALEAFEGKRITQTKLRQAVRTYNINRRLMRQVYEMRHAPSPPLSGSEAMLMVLSSQLMDKTEHNDLMAQFIQELEGRKNGVGKKLRLLLVGSELDDVGLYQLIEELGGDVVIDDNCVGSRYFWNEGKVWDKDLLGAVAARYLNKPPCPVYDYVEGSRRMPHIMGLAQEYGVQGVVIVHQKFCDPHEYDIPSIETMFKKANIPTLKLEMDITIPVGQFRTRLEAFFETIELAV